MTKKKPEEEKIFEWFEEWLRCRNEKWSKNTKIWFVVTLSFIVVTLSFMFLSSFIPVFTIATVVYYMFGVATTLFVIHVTNDEKLTNRKKKEKPKE